MNFLNIFKPKTPTKIGPINMKMLEQLSAVIDSITVQDGKVLVKLSKDIIIENSGNTVVINEGRNITIAGEIHFNPDLPLAPLDDVKKFKLK